MFPQNTEFAHRIPYFVDKSGTQCAVAYLVAQSGHSDLVARIAHRQNHALVDELAANTELALWLRNAGLSVREAARIQPGYDPAPLKRFDTWFSSAGLGPQGSTSGYTINREQWAGVVFTIPEHVRLTYVAAHVWSNTAAELWLAAKEANMVDAHPTVGCTLHHRQGGCALLLCGVLLSVVSRRRLRTTQ